MQVLINGLTVELKGENWREELDYLLEKYKVEKVTSEPEVPAEEDVSAPRKVRKVRKAKAVPKPKKEKAAPKPKKEKAAPNPKKLLTAFTEAGEAGLLSAAVKDLLGGAGNRGLAGSIANALKDAGLEEPEGAFEKKTLPGNKPGWGLTASALKKLL